MISNSLHKKYSNYHCCFVRECKNTSIRTPGKLWIKAPTDIKLRNTWIELAQRDPKSVSPLTKTYFCDDHFDLENDMVNYMQYKIMGSVKQIRLKPDCVPTRFDCISNYGKCKAAPTPPGKTPGTSRRRTKEKEIDETVALPRCAECLHRIKDCMLVCVQCADSKWCSACADLALHPRHYLIRVPANRPQNEIDEVFESLRLILAKQAATSEDTAVHGDNLIDNESDNATPIDIEFKEEIEIFEETFLTTLAEKQKDDVTPQELGLDQTSTEEMMHMVKKELEEVDPLMQSENMVPLSQVKLESDLDCTLDPSTGILWTEPDPSTIEDSDLNTPQSDLPRQNSETTKNSNTTKPHKSQLLGTKRPAENERTYQLHRNKAKVKKLVIKTSHLVDIAPQRRFPFIKPVVVFKSKPNLRL